MLSMPLGQGTWIFSVSSEIISLSPPTWWTEGISRLARASERVLDSDRQYERNPEKGKTHPN
jgi:hypothetical protein